MNLNSFDWTIILPAFLAGILVLSTHVPLGAQVLKRGIVFIDLAIAQIAALGVTCASLMGFDPQSWAMQIAAGTAALLGALLLTWTEKRWPEVQEAQIGVVFVLAATGGLLLLANHPHGGEHDQTGEHQCRDQRQQAPQHIAAQSECLLQPRPGVRCRQASFPRVCRL